MPDQVAKPQTPPPVTQPKPEVREPGDGLSSERMAKFIEEQRLFSPEPEPTPQPTPPPVPGKPYRVLKVDGREIPVKTEEELIALAQQGVDYTQKRQRDAEWERQLQERDQLFKKLEDPIRILAERAKAGKPLIEEEQPADVSPFGNLEEEDTISDPVAAKKLSAVEAELQTHREMVEAYNMEKKQKEIEAQGAKISEVFKAAREEHPFEDVTREGDDMKLSDMMFAGYVAALDKREKIKAQFTEGYTPRPVAETIKIAAQDFNFFQEKLRGNQAAPATLTAEILQRNRPDLFNQIAELAVKNYIEERSGRVPIVKPGEGEARPFRPAKRESGDGLNESLRKAMEDPEILAGLDALGREALFDIRKYGLKNT